MNNCDNYQIILEAVINGEMTFREAACIMENINTDIRGTEQKWKSDLETAKKEFKMAMKEKNADKATESLDKMSSLIDDAQAKLKEIHDNPEYLKDAAKTNTIAFFLGNIGTLISVISSYAAMKAFFAYVDFDNYGENDKYVPDEEYRKKYKTYLTANNVVRLIGALQNSRKLILKNHGNFASQNNANDYNLLLANAMNNINKSKEVIIKLRHKLAKKSKKWH